MTPTTGIFGDLNLVPALQSFVSDASGMIVELLPVGVGLILVLAAPRIVRRIVGAFV
ncbi:MAG: hypothetical protein FWC16_03410 [Defluviitaleaceae bacterium]|nr:hypothetical protein [Defluviitaleaceae bacterium]MCL2273950.1 hypothetical protein [Defluviitaleaceae bacterium]